MFITLMPSKWSYDVISMKLKQFTAPENLPQRTDSALLHLFFSVSPKWHPTTIRTFEETMGQSLKTGKCLIQVGFRLAALLQHTIYTSYWLSQTVAYRLETSCTGERPDSQLKSRRTKQSPVLAQLFARPLSLTSLWEAQRLHWCAKSGPSTQNYCSISTLLCKHSPKTCLSNHWDTMNFATAFSTKHQKKQLL